MLNGLGGSGDFLRNAKISIMHTPSALVLLYHSLSSPFLTFIPSRPTKSDPTGISCIVPFASHVDQTGASSRLWLIFCSMLTLMKPEHDLDIIVTEQGYADLRGLSPRERAPLIIEKCAHPDYKDLLQEVRGRLYSHYTRF
jgi:acetyl-CoA hydrolase